MSTEIITKYGVSKYKNMGNTCYMNSILHILQQVPLFIEYITKFQFRDAFLLKYQAKTEEIKETLTFELFRLFRASVENDDTSITPTSFKIMVGKKNDMFEGFQQQDSQEFFNFLISQLEEEIGLKTKIIIGSFVDDIETDMVSPIFSLRNIIAAKSKEQFQCREYSPLKNMFNGMTITTKRCSCCESINNVFEPFVTLGLSIPNNNNEYSVYDCLDHMVHEEQLDHNNRLNCDMCGIKNRFMSHIKLWQTPKVVVIHLKRFLTNSYGIPIRKLNNMITYPIRDLDLSKYFDEASPYKSSCKYDLIGVNIHIAFGGGSINCGHYKSYVKNMINNKWNIYNDGNEVVNITKMEDIINKDAYLLFYYRHD